MNFISVGKEEDSLLINIEAIVAVTSVYGDDAWRRYAIVLNNGEKFEFYEGRSADSKYMPRKVFLQKLRKFANING